MIAGHSRARSGLSVAVSWGPLSRPASCYKSVSTVARVVLSIHTILVQYVPSIGRPTILLVQRDLMMV